MKNGIRKTGIIAAFIFFLFSSNRLVAAVFFVDVLNSSYSPSSLQISVGDTVVWTNQDDDDDSHTATSNNNTWFGGLMVGLGDQFSFTFNSLGTFFYHDAFDSFAGNITVVAATSDPVVITSPKRIGNQFQFDISGLVVGRSNIIEASTNLTSWVPLVSNVATSVTASCTNSQVSTFGTRFFRVVQLP